MSCHMYLKFYNAGYNLLYPLNTTQVYNMIEKSTTFNNILWLTHGHNTKKHSAWFQCNVQLQKATHTRLVLANDETFMSAERPVLAHNPSWENDSNNSCYQHCFLSKISIIAASLQLHGRIRVLLSQYVSLKIQIRCEWIAGHYK